MRIDDPLMKMNLNLGGGEARAAQVRVTEDPVIGLRLDAVS